MAIIEEGGIKFLDGITGKYIVVESDRIVDYIEYMNKNKIKAIYLCSLYYFNKEADFLQQCNFIERLNITSSSIENYSGLSYLHRLQELSLNEPKGKVDLGNHMDLKSLSVEFNKNIVGMGQLKNIKKLSLWNYRPKSKNLSEISELKDLQELEIIKSSIHSLEGSGNLRNLERLKLGYLNQLSYIDELEKIRESLKVLNFESCKKIVNHEYVACLNNLKELSFNECGNIETIHFIDQMPNLKRFIFMGTNIIDGNLQACARLEYVAFTNKKHFSHKNSDFQ